MENENKSSIFSKSFENIRIRNKESDAFLETASHVIKRALHETEGFEEFNKVVRYDIVTNPKIPGWLAVKFSDRLLGRVDVKGNHAREQGPSLVYSRGPNGQMIVMLFPISSEIASANEDTLFLRIGFFDQWELRQGVRQDVKDLIAYAYETSIDLYPTFSQKFRIKWLRFANEKNVDGKHQYSPRKVAIRKLLGMAFSGAFTGTFRFITPAALGWFVGRYGTDWLTNWFK
ncbi:hypothetical protein [Brucella sp. NBRC 12950]|uniref:hypothetical protein n=1 Tax=Brucella sp. NBRC 12950 TaxID=2994518 RepID=UPI0024A4E25A|nr:hypothetical protein [Brucella sp. NBRC 12950]GLU25536.1 hypothetical protein Brsp01_07690 [Brucella sp. NBRC 12950]